MDLDLGRLKFRSSGYCAGHRGMASIIDVLGSDDISRLRIGISKPLEVDCVDYVLSDFSLKSRTAFPSFISRTLPR